MKSLIRKSSWILPVAVVLFACGGKEKKKDVAEVAVAETSKTKTLAIEKPQLTDEQVSTIETLSLYCLSVDVNGKLTTPSTALKRNLRT